MEHLEALDIDHCDDVMLETFSRAHMSYINQIFGDETIRTIIQEVYNKGGKLVIVPSGPEFEDSVHHIFYYDKDEEVEQPVFDRNDPNGNVAAATSPRHNNAIGSPLPNAPPRPNNGPTRQQSRQAALAALPPLPASPRAVGGASAAAASPRAIATPAQNNNTVVRNVMGNMVNKVAANNNKQSNAGSENTDWAQYSSKVCSGELGYQDLAVDINDTLCQSYSLMAYLDVDFDSTPSKEATREQKYNKHLSMIKMYRMILANKAFVREFNKIVKDPDNAELWEDTVDEGNEFFMIEKYKRPAVIIGNIKKVLDIWERWGWQYFVGDGKCEKKNSVGGARRRSRTTRRGSRTRGSRRTKQN